MYTVVATGGVCRKVRIAKIQISLRIPTVWSES